MQWNKADDAAVRGFWYATPQRYRWSRPSGRRRVLIAKCALAFSALLCSSSRFESVWHDALDAALITLSEISRSYRNQSLYCSAWALCKNEAYGRIHRSMVSSFDVANHVQRAWRAYILTALIYSSPIKEIGKGRHLDAASGDNCIDKMPSVLQAMSIIIRWNSATPSRRLRRNQSGEADLHGFFAKSICQNARPA